MIDYKKEFVDIYNIMPFNDITGRAIIASMLGLTLYKEYLLFHYRCFLESRNTKSIIIIEAINGYSIDLDTLKHILYMNKGDLVDFLVGVFKEVLSGYRTLKKLITHFV